MQTSRKFLMMISSNPLLLTCCSVIRSSHGAAIQRQASKCASDIFGDERQESITAQPLQVVRHLLTHETLDCDVVHMKSQYWLHC